MTNCCGGDGGAKKYLFQAALSFFLVGLVYLARDQEEGNEGAAGAMLFGFLLFTFGRFVLSKLRSKHLLLGDASKQQSMLDGFPAVVQDVAQSVMSERTSNNHDTSSSSSPKQPTESSSFDPQTSSICDFYKSLKSELTDTVKEVTNSSSKQQQTAVDLAASPMLLLLEPQSGIYKCLRSELTITDKKTSETVRSAAPTSSTTDQGQQELLSEECTLSLKFSRVVAGGTSDEESATAHGGGGGDGKAAADGADGASTGWSIRGTNRVSKGGVYVIEEGFVSAYTGKGYWVERSSGDSRLAIVSMGYFKGDLFENSEFYTSFGQRGRYEDYHPVVHQDCPTLTGDGEASGSLTVPAATCDTSDTANEILSPSHATAEP